MSTKNGTAFAVPFFMQAKQNAAVSSGVSLSKKPSFVEKRKMAF